MKETEDLGSFFAASKNIFQEYLETRLEIYRLQGIRAFSRSSGFLIWVIISLFLLFLIFIFAGLVTGFWLSELTGSYIAGFGITTLIMILIFSVLAMLRHSLFVNPIIRVLLKKSLEERATEKTA